MSYYFVVQRDLNSSPCQARPTLHSNCLGSCSTIDDPYTGVCIPNKVKNFILKVYNSVIGVNQTKHLVQNESGENKYGFNESVYNSLKKRKHDECRRN